MFNKLKKKLAEIQNSDEQTKKRWLIGMSAIAMVIVVGLWLIYVNSTIESLGGSQEVSKSSDSIGFLQVFETGLKVVGKSVKNEVKNLISKIIGERTITIE